MEINYLTLLDYCSGKIIVIKLTNEQRDKAYGYEDLEEYITTIEDEYGFRLKGCCWMTGENFRLEPHGFSENLSIGG